MTLTTQEILDRAVARGDFADIQQAAEQEAAAEAVEREQHQAETEAAARAVLADTRAAFKAERDARFKLQQQYVKRQASYEAAQVAYASAQRACRALQIFETCDEVCMDKLREALSGSYEDRKAMGEIRAALFAGI